ncbi:hypothetical protein [Desulfitibacter alkalitolerans]|uniref:hypothetical protein n=1 Tax=Desulfitibacter alkalitolerans TaxID=264641 RepID=UPI00048A04D3|nr:hypothetical protein [Desulfitibacter alkalitolerans]
MVKFKTVLKIYLIIFISLIFLTSCAQERAREDVNTDPYQVIHSDERRSWSFDAATMELVEDEELGISYINVWIKVEYNEPVPSGGIDIMLWHLDTNVKQYKISDSYAYNICDGALVES